MNTHKWRAMRVSGAWPFIAMMAAGSQAGGRRRGSGWGDWEDWDEMGAPGMRRSRGRRRRMFGSGELRLVLLKLIADEPRHGYELIKAVEELTDGAYSPSPGTVYPTLSLLEDEGAIAPSPEGDGARKAYAATDAGRAELEERADEVAGLIARLAGQAEKRKPFASPDLFRAVGNLASVLKIRARAGKLDGEAIDSIVDMIDELARKIERL